VVTNTTILGIDYWWASHLSRSKKNISQFIFLVHVAILFTFTNHERPHLPIAHLSLCATACHSLVLTTPLSISPHHNIVAPPILAHLRSLLSKDATTPNSRSMSHNPMRKVQQQILWHRRHQGSRQSLPWTLTSLRSGAALFVGDNSISTVVKSTWIAVWTYHASPLNVGVELF
jgi:hypothetical protein